MSSNNSVLVMVVQFKNQKRHLLRLVLDAT
jgi:hypothetical protein